MYKAAVTFLSLLVALVPAPADQPVPARQLNDYYPAIEPFRTGYLKVSDVHEIYYELCGNPQGRPVMILHGGPGGGCYPTLRRYHDPTKYLIVLHDQRGAGRSKPFCELSDNNTQALVRDVEALRKHLDLGQVQVFGGSWGSTLGLAYAEAYPASVQSLVIRGIFTATKGEIDHFYHGGVAAHFPEVFDKLQVLLPNPERHDYPRQLLTMLGSPDPEVRRKASLGWAGYEMKLAALEQADAEIQGFFEEWDPYDFSLIENYYMANGCFLAEGQLLAEAHRIAAIPTVIVQGRYDVICPPITAFRLHRALPNSKLVIVESAGHSGSEPGIRSALIDAVKSLE